MGLAFLTNLIAQGISLAWSFLSLTACEMVAPAERHSLSCRLRAVMIWALYLPILAGVAVAGAAVARALGVKPWVNLDLTPSPTMNAVIRVPLTALAVYAVMATSDFCYYWMHRAQHRFAWLWRFHAVHHSIRELNALNSYHHWSEEFFRLVFITVPLIFINVHAAQAVIALSLLRLQFAWTHSAVTVSWGPLRVLLNDPTMHRVHHSLDPRHRDRNFAAFTPIWDVLFGTVYFPAKGEWPQTGVQGSPEVTGIADYIVRPFRTAA
jgi:sterol desaturase/sphingolipid hydroxylase (fatty acid hydroxylase superfamily)